VVDEPAASAFDDHFRQPRNAGVLQDADGQVAVDNPVCGDELILYWKTTDDDTVNDVRFQVYGCPAAIAAGSVLTELLRGKKTGALSSINEDKIATALGGLSSQRAHAAVLAMDALRAMLKKMA
jgi:nitrogen fixation NifU-like protein